MLGGLVGVSWREQIGLWALPCSLAPPWPPESRPRLSVTRECRCTPTHSLTEQGQPGVTQAVSPSPGVRLARRAGSVTRSGLGVSVGRPETKPFHPTVKSRVCRDRAVLEKDPLGLCLKMTDSPMEGGGREAETLPLAPPGPASPAPGQGSGWGESRSPGDPVLS